MYFSVVIPLLELFLCSWLAPLSMLSSASICCILGSLFSPMRLTPDILIVPHAYAYMSTYTKMRFKCITS